VTDQLSLTLGGDDQDEPGLPEKLPFPVAVKAGRPFDDDSFYFEPWWPGAHAFLRREGDRLELRLEHLADPLTAFPELASDLAALSADGIIVEGTLLALDGEGRPDQALLRRRLEGTVSGIAEGAFVASDLIYLEGRSIARKPFAERRRMLLATIGGGSHHVVSRGLSGEGVTLGHAAASMGLEAISARRLDGRWKGGRETDGWLRMHVTEPPAAEVRPLMVLLEKLPLDA
jgi:bifunctional non-homologous end joining protein LigD